MKEYEKQIISCLNDNGWSVDSTRISNDDSIFILASRDDSDYLLTQSLWEAKSIDSENRVSLSIVHELSASREESNGQNTAVVLTGQISSSKIAWIKKDTYRLSEDDIIDIREWILGKQYPKTV